MMKREGGFNPGTFLGRDAKVTEKYEAQ